jgi:hypothetical protein
MIVAVRSVRMVQVAVHQVVHVIAMRHCLMPAGRTVMVVGGMIAAFMVRSTCVPIGPAYFQPVFVDVAAVDVMEMSIVKIVGMVVVFQRRVTAVGPMSMRMLFVDLAGFLHMCCSSTVSSCPPV